MAGTKELVRRQLRDQEKDVFTGLPFLDDGDEAHTPIDVDEDEE